MRSIVVQASTAVVALAAAFGIHAQDAKKPEAANSAGPDAVMSSVVLLKAKALPNARSNETLGQNREGTGIVIDDKGHVLTIGYLVIEPDSIELTTSEGKTVPAVLAGYDHATGFGLLRATTPLGVKPIEIGSSGNLGEQEAVMVLPHGGRQAASLARVVSKRPFTASWEYQLEQAIFTTPPTMSWAGAALINRELKLVGVGSLFIREAGARGQEMPGNMFVPIDVLKPILKDLIAKGKRDGPTRPWLGLATEEVFGRLLVTRVTPEGPADKAGLKQGDIVLGVGTDTVKTHAELYGKMWGRGAAGVEIPLKVLQGAELRDVKVKSIDRAEYFRDKPVN
jgi:S1-C subfamily serine protease